LATAAILPTHPGPQPVPMLHFRLPTRGRQAVIEPAPHHRDDEDGAIASPFSGQAASARATALGFCYSSPAARSCLLELIAHKNCPSCALNETSKNVCELVGWLRAAKRIK